MLYFIYIIIIIAFLDTFAQLPIIAPFAQNIGASNFLTGLIIGMYSLANMGGNVIAGQWIDRFGRKKILVIGMITVSVFLLGYTYVKTAEQLLFMRFLHGIAGGLLVPAAFAFLGDRSNANNRGKTMAFSGACVGISAIIGPAFGAIVNARLGIDAVFYILSIVFFLSAILVSIFIKETSFISAPKKDAFDWARIIKLLTLPPLVNAYIGASSLMLTLGILAYMLPLKIVANGLNPAFSGMLMSTFGIVAILFFLLPTNKLFDKIKRENMILVGMLLVTFSLIVLSSYENISVLFLAMGIYGLGFAFIFPSSTALVIDHSDKTERGRAFGLFYAFFSLGVVIGSMFVGALNVVPNQGLFIGSLTMLFLAVIIFFRTRNLIINNR